MDTPSPTVSIVTPAYNAERLLSDTVASVLAQTFRDFELLIVDDGSTDGTLELARHWARTDSRVRVFTQRNGGSSAARNIGIRHSRGEYIALLDSDDLWQPAFLATQMAIFDQHADVDVVTGNAYNLGGGFDGQPLRPAGSQWRRLSLLDILEHEDAVCIMSVFRRSVPERIGGFDETVIHNEDYDYWIRAAHAGFSFVANPAPLAYYRRHAESKSTNETGIIEGIVGVLRQARTLRQLQPAELAAIDRQINRFEQERILARAKASLRSREFVVAAREFEALSKLKGDFLSGAIARISRHVPQALLWAYCAKGAFRARRRLRSA